MRAIKPRLWIAGRWSLWLCMAFIMLRGFVSLLPSGTSAASAPPVPATETDSAADPSPGGFATLFAHEYLTFAPGDDQGRTARLQPFLAPNLDPGAGVSARAAKKAQTVIQAWPWRVEQTGPDQRLVTVVAQVQESQDPKAEPTPPRLIALAVPLVQARDGYVVAAYPSFVPVPLKRPAGEISDGLPGEPVAEPDPQVGDLLTGFLKAYSSGTPAEIRYFLPPGSDLTGLDGQFLFRNLVNFQLRKDATTTWAVAEVLFEDPATHVEFRQQLVLEVAKQERWYVKAIQPQGGTGK